jgi:hypothetical protein
VLFETEIVVAHRVKFQQARQFGSLAGRLLELLAFPIHSPPIFKLVHHLPRLPRRPPDHRHHSQHEQLEQRPAAANPASHCVSNVIVK